MTRGFLFFLVVGILGAPSAYAADDEYLISLVVTGAEPGIGQVLVSLFESEETYMEAPLSEANVDVDGEGKVLFSLGEFTPGEYAIVVIYDENENGKLDTGMFRIPKEKIGYSNNAKGKFGPAKWTDVRFLVTDTDVNVDVQLANAKSDE